MLKSHSILSRLSARLSVLQRRIKDHISQLSLRRSLIALTSNKMTSVAEKRKRSTTEIIKKYLYFFDSSSLFKRILSFKIRESMYFDIEEFRTNLVQL